MLVNVFSLFKFILLIVIDEYKIFVILVIVNLRGVICLVVSKWINIGYMLGFWMLEEVGGNYNDIEFNYNFRESI